jgi:hypothetical protein
VTPDGRDPAEWASIEKIQRARRVVDLVAGGLATYAELGLRTAAGDVPAWCLHDRWFLENLYAATRAEAAGR